MCTLHERFLIILIGQKIDNLLKMEVIFHINSVLAVDDYTGELEDWYFPDGIMTLEHHCMKFIELQRNYVENKTFFQKIIIFSFISRTFQIKFGNLSVINVM